MWRTSVAHRFGLGRGVTACRVLSLILCLGGCGGSCGDGSDSKARASGLSWPWAFGDLKPHLDLTEHFHLADVDDGGLFIPFGSPARMKYTVGHWKTGWVADLVDGKRTYSLVSDKGRLFFHVDRRNDLLVRLRLKSLGPRKLTVYMNNHALPVVNLENGKGGFANYDMVVPQRYVVRGENYMLLRFGGVGRFQGYQASAAVEHMRVLSVASGSASKASFSTDPPSPVVQRVSLHGQNRRAVKLRKGGRLSYHLEVLPGMRLGFGLSSANSKRKTAGKVRLVHSRGVQTIAAFTDVSSWKDKVVPLEPWLGQVVRVDFEVTAGDGYWGSIHALREKAAPEVKRTAKNVVIVLVDTLRADKLKPFDRRSRVKTPVVDQLAKEGAVFLQAQSPENWTKPAVASVLTGLYPASHHAKTDEAKLSKDALMLSEHMKGAGFATGSFIANGYVSDKFGFDQGWDYYTNFIRERKTTDAENVFREAFGWIKKQKGKRFFAYIQTIDPHVPYDPPEAFLKLYDRGAYAGAVTPRRTPDLLAKAKRSPPAVTFTDADKRRLKALHDGEISYHDVHLGRFVEQLKKMGVWEDTLFVLTSDHGEELDDHGKWGHGHSLYQELLNVPLMFRLPRSVPPGVKVAHTVSTVDIPSTVLELTGLDGMPHDEGHSLVPWMHGVWGYGLPMAVSDFLDDRRAIRAGRWKMELRGINTSFYDLKRDPREQRPLSKAQRPLGLRYCRVLLGQFLGASDYGDWLSAEQGRAARLKKEKADVDPTLRGQLEALGYVE